MIYSKYFALTLKDIDEGAAGDDRRDDAARSAARTVARELLGSRERLTEKDLCCFRTKAHAVLGITMH